MKNVQQFLVSTVLTHIKDRGKVTDFCHIVCRYPCLLERWWSAFWSREQRINGVYWNSLQILQGSVWWWEMVEGDIFVLKDRRPTWLWGTRTLLESITIYSPAVDQMMWRRSSSRRKMSTNPKVIFESICNRLMEHLTRMMAVKWIGMFIALWILAAVPAQILLGWMIVYKPQSIIHLDTSKEC